MAKRRPGPKSWGPGEHLKQVEAHRSPLFRATWEATRSPLTIQAVSQLTGGRVGVDILQHWVRGKSVPNLESAELLARVLGRPDLLSWLAEGKLYLGRLRQAADEVDCDTEHRNARRPQPGKVVEHLRGPEPLPGAQAGREVSVPLTARSKRRPGAEGEAGGPLDCLKRLEAHRFPLFLAAWEATGSDLTGEEVSHLTAGRITTLTLHGWVRGRTLPTLEAAEVLAKALGRPDLVSWLGEGALYLERLRQVACAVECDAERRKARCRMLARIGRKGVGEALEEHFQGLSRGRRQALFRDLEKLAPPQR